MNIHLDAVRLLVQSRHTREATLHVAQIVGTEQLTGVTGLKAEGSEKCGV